MIASRLFKLLTSLMLKSQQPRARTGGIGAHAQVHAEFAWEFEEVFATARTVGSIAFALAIRLKI